MFQDKMRNIFFRQIITSDDLVWTPFYLLIILAIAIFVRNILYRMDDPLRKYFIPALSVKMLGAICVGLIYTFYYPGGDTTEFFNNALVFNSAFNDDPINFWKLLTNPAVNTDPAIQGYRPWMYFVRDPASYTIGKMAGVINLFTFNLYTPCALIFAAISFTGVWALYVTFCKIYPTMYKQFALGILFVPSVFFWGSGILKDSVTFGCVGWMTYCSYELFIKGRGFFWNIVILSIAGYLVAIIKPYILFAFVPALLFWIFLNYRNRIGSNFLRIMLGPVVFFMTIGLGAVVIQRLGSEFKQYSFNNALKTSQNYQAWHEFLSETGNVGSGYNLGAIDGSFFSILSKIPAATNVTLFRPYLWEARNPVMILSAIESFIILFFTLRIIIKTGLGATLRLLVNNPTAFFCFFFAVFFGFCVGFTAYNFGALVRYKIPCIPFYVAGLFILYHETKIYRLTKHAKARVM